MKCDKHLLLFAMVVFAVHAGREQLHAQKNFNTTGKQMNDHKEVQDISAEWLTYVKDVTNLKTGIVTAQDRYGAPIILEWERVDSPSPRLNEKIKSLAAILVQTYVKQEAQFARKYPEAVPHEHFLKSLEPLFVDGLEKVDWDLVEKQLTAIFQQVFTTTDFTKFSGAHDVHIFVVAKDKSTGAMLGVIQFLVAPEYAYGTVKAAYYGVMSSAHNRGLEKLLMSSIFKLIPAAKIIFLHTRVTNDKALNNYYYWGFTQLPGTLANWVNLEYRAEQSNMLQKTAESFE